MAWTALADKNTGDLVTSTEWNNILGVDGNLEYLYNPDACRVYHSSDQSIDTATLTALAFNSERFDTNTLHDTSTNNSRLTCQRAGLYAIFGSIYWESGTTGNYLLIREGGDTTIAQTDGVDENRQSISTLYKLAAAEYVELVVYHGTGSGQNIENHANYSPEFGMCWLGTG